MPSYIYDKLKQQEGNLDRSERESQEWFRKAAQSITSISGNKLMKSDRPRLLPSRKIYPKHIGRMMMFYYDPKTKEQLKYWDTFPLIFPINIYRDGFLGMNMHYLPRKLRANLMDGLYDTYNNQHLNENQKLRMSYQMLTASMKYRFFRPTIHRYLGSHVRSRFFLVDPQEWDMTLMLPTERFVGATKNRVWMDSMNKLGLGLGT